MPIQKRLCANPRPTFISNHGNSLKRLLLVIAAIGLSWLGTASRSVGQIPQGVFSLSNSGKIANDTVLADPNVMGVSIRYGWIDLEPIEGAFNWSFLDAEVARIGASGKKVLLRIATQSGKPAWVTKAVRKKKGKFFTFEDDGVLTSIPVFWDPTFLQKKKNMIAALGAHFTNNPNVAIVTASFANASSEDWAVPHDPEYVEQWLRLGYTTQKMLDAGKQIVDATMAAFPNQYVAMAIGSNGHSGSTGNLDPTADYVAENVILQCRPHLARPLYSTDQQPFHFQPESTRGRRLDLESALAQPARHRHTNALLGF